MQKISRRDKIAIFSPIMHIDKLKLIIPNFYYRVYIIESYISAYTWANKIQCISILCYWYVTIHFCPKTTLYPQYRRLFSQEFDLISATKILAPFCPFLRYFWHYRSRLFSLEFILALISPSLTLTHPKCTLTLISP